MNVFLLSQILIGIAFILNIAAFQFKDRRLILFLFILATLLIGFHFLLLERLTAAFLIFLATLRYSVALYTKGSLWSIIFIIATVVIAAFTYQGSATIFAALGSSCASIGSFRTTDKSLRLWMMANSAFWIVHNTIAFSPAAIALDSFFILSNLVGYYRFYLRSDAHRYRSPGNS